MTPIPLHHIPAMQPKKSCYCYCYWLLCKK